MSRWSGADVVHVRDDEGGEWHVSESARIVRGTIDPADTRFVSTLCGEEIPTDDVGSWSEREPRGKATAPSCPDCLAAGIEEDQDGADDGDRASQTLDDYREQNEDGGLDA